MGSLPQGKQLFWPCQSAQMPGEFVMFVGVGVLGKVEHST